VTLISVVDRLLIVDRIGRGTSRTISMSNTIKIIARRKNRIENGTRALWFGSNPHSKGEDFSRLRVDRAAHIHAIKNTIKGSIIAINDDINSRVIN
jgi:hypothetical protein